MLIAKELSGLFAPRKSRNDSLISGLRNGARSRQGCRFGLAGLRGTGITEVDHGMSMRRMGEIIGKPGRQNFASVLKGLGGFGRSGFLTAKLGPSEQEGRE